MTAYVALLRAVNVGGRNRVAMSELLGLIAALGLADGRSLLQSGNLVFKGEGGTSAELEQLLEIETEKRLSLRTDYLVRTSDEWQAIVEGNPFAGDAARDPSHVVVMFLKDAPEASAVEALQGAIRGRELARAEGKQLYLVYPDGIGTSKLTNSVVEGRLGIRGTGRNWNTVLKLAELVRA